MFGYDTGVINGALVQLSDEFGLSTLQKESIVSMTVFGALISSCIAGWLSDKFGRRVVILISSVFFIIGSLFLSVFAFDYIYLIAGRFIVGLGVGSASMIMPLYVCEASPTNIRGAMITYINVAITFGQFFSSCICGIFSGLRYGWKIMLGCAALPAIIQFIGFLFLPESPRWLIQQGYYDEASLVLRKIRNRSDVSIEIDEILMAIKLEDSGDSTIFAKLSQKTVYRALLLGCMLQVAQQFGGINTVMYYSSSILRLAGFTSNSQTILLTIAISFCNFVGSIVGLCLVDRYGRRWLTLSSLLLVALVLCGISLTFYLAQHGSPKTSISSCGSKTYDWCFDCIQNDDCRYCSAVSVLTNGSLLSSGLSGCLSKQSSDSSGSGSEYACLSSLSQQCPGCEGYGWAIFSLLCAYLLAFAPGMGAMPWCVNSEIYPLGVRGAAVSIATAANWSANLAMSASFLSVIEYATNAGAFFLYGSVALAFLGYFYIYLPETKAVPLEQIEQLFSDFEWGVAWKQSSSIEEEESEVSSLFQRRYTEGGGSRHSITHSLAGLDDRVFSSDTSVYSFIPTSGR